MSLLRRGTNAESSSEKRAQATTAQQQNIPPETESTYVIPRMFDNSINNCGLEKLPPKAGKRQRAELPAVM